MSDWKKLPFYEIRRRIASVCEGEIEVHFTMQGDIRIVRQGKSIDLLIPNREIRSLMLQLDTVRRVLNARNDTDELVDADSPAMSRSGHD